MIRLVATDLDGTLWGPDMVVPVAHTEAVAELATRGIRVLAATSRRPRVVRAAFARAGLALPAVLLDGAVGIDFRTESRFHQVAFQPADAAAVLACFRDAGLDPCVYVDDPDVDVIVSETPSTCISHLNNFRSFVGVADLEVTVSTRPVYAFAVLGLPRRHLKAAARAVHPERGEVMVYAEPSYGEYGLIVNAPGITKWSGVETYCHRHHISASEVLAVGDGDNDVSMLSQAGMAVAVSAGTKAVLKVAHHQIPPPSQGGWAELLNLVP